jgi:hypothetical protein
MAGALCIPFDAPVESWDARSQLELLQEFFIATTVFRQGGDPDSIFAGYKNFSMRHYLSH